VNIPRVRTRRTFGAATDAVKFRQRRPGLLGRPDSGGTYTIDAPGGHGYVFVRIVQGLGSSLAMAVDQIGISATGTGDEPIWLEYDSDRRLIIVGTRYSGT